MSLKDKIKTNIKKAIKLTSLTQFLSKLKGKQSANNDLANDEKTMIDMSCLIELDKINNKDDLKVGDIVLHRHIKLYRVTGFGKVQIHGEWLDTINYEEVFKTVDLSFTRLVNDFLISFKKVNKMSEINIELKQ